MSVKFTVDMPDELNKWLEDQAKETVRSKNGQLVYLVKLAMEQSKKLDPPFQLVTNKE